MTVVKKRVKALPSSQRGKKRYILFELLAEKPLSAAIVEKEIERKFFELFGSRGMASQKLHFIGFYGEKNLGVLKCSLEKCEECKAGLIFMKGIAGMAVVPRIVKVSGSAKKLKEIVK